MPPEDFVEVVSRLSRRDEHHCGLLSRCQALEREYLQVLSRLPGEDRRVIEEYITLCEEMEFRKSQLAAEYYARRGPDCAENPP